MLLRGACSLQQSVALLAIMIRCDATIALYAEGPANSHVSIFAVMRQQVSSPRFPSKNDGTLEQQRPC